MLARCFSVPNPGPQAAHSPRAQAQGQADAADFTEHPAPSMSAAGLGPGDLFGDTQCRKQQDEDTEMGTRRSPQRGSLWKAMHRG